MAKLDEEKLKEQIKAQSFSNAYFIYGEESYLKEYYVGVLREKLVSLNLLVNKTIIRLISHYILIGCIER